MPAPGSTGCSGSAIASDITGPNAAIQKALKALCANIDGASGEVGLIAQFAKLPEGRAGSGLPLSQQIVEARVGAVVAKYSAACWPGD